MSRKSTRTARSNRSNRSSTIKKVGALLATLVAGVLGYQHIDFQHGNISTWIEQGLQMIGQHKSSIPSLKTDKSTQLVASCESNLYQGKRPEIHIIKMAEQAKELCFTGYAAKASFISKSNLYSAEKLTLERVNQKIPRENPFHAEEQLPAGKRAELEDYRRSGFDRGHLAPNADMLTSKSQYESFSLANMIPQVPEHNQKTWSAVESITRNLAKKHKEIYVVTMPVYQNADGSFPSNIKAIGANQVYIPQFVAKAIYIPSINKAVVVFSPNNKKNEVTTLSLDEFYQISSVDVFPSLPKSVKQMNGGFFNYDR